MFGLARFSPTVLAVPPSYEPEKVKVESVAERLARLEPSAIPEMVEFWSEAFGMLDVTSAPAERARPVPVRSLNDSPLIIKFVVEAVLNDP